MLAVPTLSETITEYWNVMNLQVLTFWICSSRALAIVDAALIFSPAI